MKPVLRRRQALAWALGLRHGFWAVPGLVQAHSTLGPIAPRRAPPELTLTLHDGRAQPLGALLKGRVTAVQLMFTGCSAICPVQGAQFAALQARLSSLKLGPTQLLSISIDPLNDDAAALAAWRRKYAAGPQWLAASPAVRHAQTMLEFLQARKAGDKAGDKDAHKAQTYLFDALGRHAFTVAELASASDIAKAIAGLQAQGL